MISVPDLPTLCRLYLRTDLTPKDRVMVMKMMYGAQMDSHDYHHIGFNFDLLGSSLQEVGFCNVTRVESFNINFLHAETNASFTDTSEMSFNGVRVSLNVYAKVCHGDKKNTFHDNFAIHPSNATPYKEANGS
ncbi:hypothetical protein EON65_51950 [archaeon]|nr:MAG: hypothetical protein EON65_51950 [archaeon]